MLTGRPVKHGCPLVGAPLTMPERSHSPAFGLGMSLAVSGLAEQAKRAIRATTRVGGISRGSISAPLKTWFAVSSSAPRPADQFSDCDTQYRIALRAVAAQSAGGSRAR